MRNYKMPKNKDKDSTDKFADLRKLVDALMDREATLKQAQRLAQVGSWEWNLVDNSFQMSDEMCKIYGVTPRSHFDNIQTLVDETIHPDDREMIIKAVKTVVAECAGEPLTYRIIRPNGEIRWVVATRPEARRTDKDGKSEVMMGVVQDITDRKQVEETLQKRTFELDERIKELNCLYGMSRLIEKPNISLEKILQGIVDLIPPAWRYPEITCARITLENQEFSNKNFRESIWKQTSNIIVHGKLVGTLEVYYKEERPSIDEGPFLKEERRLIIAIAERLGRIVERWQYEEHIHYLSQEQIKIQESERHRIARDLHDNVAQDISTSKILTETLLDNQPNVPNEIRQKVLEMSILLQKSIKSVRDLAYDLRPSALDQLGLVQTVYQYCEDYSEQNDVNVDFFSAGMDKIQLHFDTEINLFRLIQEGLNNIKKHADADQITIRLVASSPNIILRIEDNGKGFDVEGSLIKALNEKRMGLKSMEERVSLLKGNIKIQSRLMKGTKIFIEVPYKNRKKGSNEKHIDH